jgi:hypothetical protein
MTEPEATIGPGQPALSDATRQRLDGIRRGLLRLHKALLDAERAAYEREKGRVSPGELLQLLIGDARFAWLRPFSEMVVLIDEMQEAPRDAEESPSEQDGLALLAQVRQMLSPTAGEAGSGGRYYETLQQDPAAVLAHAEVVKLLPAGSVADQ